MIASGIFDKTKEAVAKTEKEGEREKEILEQNNIEFNFQEL